MALPWISRDDYIGKWGKFWDFDGDESIVIGKLTEKKHNFFYTKDGYYNYFQPLTEEQIKILGLE